MMENEFTSRVDMGGITAKVQELRDTINAVVFGQQQLTDLLIVALLAEGHVLIEGVPGVAKTLSAKLLARTVDAGFKRIQFTPDLMPSDIIGTSVFNFKSGEFEFRKGPLFAHIVLADEINRSPAKTQAALFEAMEERQITVDAVTYPLEEPFMVIATQNPVEHEGTYRLPEAQLDRFLFKITVDYPDAASEAKILTSHHAGHPITDVSRVPRVISRVEIARLKELVSKVVVEDKLVDYIVQIVASSRRDPAIFLGASPRASVAILAAARVAASIQGRDFVTPDDVKAMCVPVMRHRVLLTPEKEMEGIQVDTLIRQLVDKIEVPR